MWLEVGTRRDQECTEQRQKIIGATKQLFDNNMPIYQRGKILIKRLLNILCFWHLRYAGFAQKHSMLTVGCSTWECHFASSQLKDLQLGKISQNLITAGLIQSLWSTVAVCIANSTIKRRERSSRGKKEALPAMLRTHTSHPPGGSRTQQHRAQLGAASTIGGPQDGIRWMVGPF